MFFESQPSSPAKNNHIVGMTQYYAHNYNDAELPKYIVTYDITSCVVLLLKNIDPSSKACGAFGMAHLNLVNVYFEDKGKENLTTFIEEFEKVGGCLETASIQLLGGLKVDDNQVRDKVANLLRLIAQEKGIENLEIKIPSGYQLDTTPESSRTGNAQIMAIACHQEGTHIRKITLEKGIIAKREYYPVNSSLLTDENIKNVIPDDPDYSRLKQKTNNFYQAINQILPLKGNIAEEIYRDYENQIKNNYCVLENSNILSQAPSPLY